MNNETNLIKLQDNKSKQKLINCITDVIKVYALGYVVKENSKIRKQKLKDNIKNNKGTHK
jgi:hypothetical protein